MLGIKKFHNMRSDYVNTCERLDRMKKRIISYKKP